jgi:hypothetical protein
VLSGDPPVRDEDKKALGTLFIVAVEAAWHIAARLEARVLADQATSPAGSRNVRVCYPPDQASPPPARLLAPEGQCSSPRVEALVPVVAIPLHGVRTVGYARFPPLQPLKACDLRCGELRKPGP